MSKPMTDEELRKHRDEIRTAYFSSQTIVEEQLTEIERLKLYR